MKKCKFSFLAIVSVISLCCAVAEAVSWDLDRDFESATVNPNGAWSYGYFDGTGFHLLAEGITEPDMGSDRYGWRTPGGDWDTYGNIQKILEGEANFEAYSSYRYGGEMCSGPGGFTGVRTGIRWVCPAADTYVVFANWQGLSTKGGGTTVDVTLEHNGTAIFTDNVAGFIGRPGQAPSGTKPEVGTARILELQAGDTLDQTLAGGADGVGSDCTNHDLYIVPLSEFPAATMNLVMQLDAGVGVSDPNRPGVPLVDGDRVGLWADQAGNGLDARAKSGWGSPILKTDGAFDVVRFDGNDGMVIYDLSDPNDEAAFTDPEDPNDRGPLGLETYTIYVVGKLNQFVTPNLAQVFLANFNAEKGYVLGISDSRPEYVKFWSNIGGEMRSVGPIDESGRYYLMTGTVTNLREKKLFANDCMDAEGYGYSAFTTATVASVGALGNGTQFLKGDIAEIRVYDGFIEATHEAVVDELSTKYSLNRDCLTNQDVVALTYATSYVTNADGATDFSYQTNTQSGDGPWDLALYDGPVSELDPNDVALNNPGNMNIYIELTLGEPKTISFANGLSGPKDPDWYYGMNLFFEDSTSHQISVFGKLTDSKEEVEPFTENAANPTAGFGGSAVAGANSKVAKIFGKERKVTISDWKMYNETVWSLDMMLATPGIPWGHDGIADHVGQFTLLVEEYQPVCTDMPAMGNPYLDMDFNEDCYVNLEDFAEFAKDWLQCNDPGNPLCE